MFSIEEDIKQLTEKMGKLETGNSELRLNKINNEINNDKLDINSLNYAELTFVHSKMHMLFYQKNPVISKESIKKYHDEIKIKLKFHPKFDKLDD